MAISEDPDNESHDANIPEKPRRKRRHFKLVNVPWLVLSLSFRSPDHVSQAEDHVSVDCKEQVDFEVTTTTDDLMSTNIVDDVTNDEQLINTTTITTNSVTPSVVDNDDVIGDHVTNVTEHTVDHVTSSDHVISNDDQSHTQDVTTSIKDSPGEHWYILNIMKSHDVTIVTSRRKRKNKFKPKEWSILYNYLYINTSVIICWVLSSYCNMCHTHVRARWGRGLVEDISLLYMLHNKHHHTYDNDAALIVTLITIVTNI